MRPRYNPPRQAPQDISSKSSPPLVPTIDEIAGEAGILEFGRYDFRSADVLALVFQMPSDREVAVTAHARLARYMNVIRPDLEIAVLEDAVEFHKVAEWLQRTAIHIERLTVEDGTTVEETIQACERIAFEGSCC